MNAEKPVVLPKSLHEDRFSDAALRSRADYDGLLYWGCDHSLQQLPHLNLTWANLGEAARETGKPIGDLGACYSTLAIEGALRGIPVTPLDITFEARKGQYVGAVLWSMERIRPFYLDQPAFPSGYGCETQVSPVKLSDDSLRALAHETLKRAIVSDISSMPFPDRHFSMTIAHHSTPKHSTDLKEFLERQLPEILRVTQLEARIGPLAIYKTLGAGEAARLQEFRNLHSDLREIAAVASAAGFTFLPDVGYEYWDSKGSFSRREEHTVGIFTRKFQ